jgi:hypothetical protein
MQQKKNEGIFHFDAKVRGPHYFVFENKNMMKTVTATFALHCGNSTEEYL